MVSPPPGTTPIVTDLLIPTSLVIVPKDKEKAPAIAQEHRSPRFALEEGEPREKLTEDAMRTTPVDTRQHFSKLKRLWKQFQEENNSGLLFPSEEFGGDFDGDNGDFGDDFMEERGLLTMIILPIVSETCNSTADLVALQSKTSLLHLFFFYFYLLFN